MTDKTFSFEFFPPKTTDGRAKLQATATELAALGPAFVSVTFGAGGSARDGTLDATRDLQALGLEVAPHLSCVGASRETLRAILDEYRARGVRRLVALRGDLPSGWGEIGELRHASELVAFVREHTGDWFHIEVAAYPEIHPQARSARDDLAHFVSKVRAGADSAITQYFYNADAYFRFVDAVRAAGVEVPIVPGIMPITNHTQLVRFSDGCGAEIPRWLRLNLASFGDDLASLRAYGLDVVTALCERLLAGGAPGLHLYTLNNAAAASALWRRMRLD